NLLSAGPSGIQQVAGRLYTGEEGVMNVSYRDSERYVAYTTVEGTGFRVASMLGTQVMFREANEVGKSITKAFLSLDAVVTDRIVELRQSFRSNLLGIVYKYALILAMLVLAVMVAGFYFARAVTQPVRRLKEKADLVSRGAVEEDIQIDTGDELEELATAFNRVIHTIKILQGRDSPASYGKPDVGEGSEPAEDEGEGSVITRP
ncbi:MAG: HAMP domain-containing protein, partial [Candidatus Nanohaloarchaea archaeon]|nr:HAMP domain-containing protein [Candidatus Nanohaloarchaea archaeon]